MVEKWPHREYPSKMLNDKSTSHTTFCDKRLYLCQKIDTQKYLKVKALEWEGRELQGESS